LQLIGKKKKKTLVLTLGSPPGKGGETKNPGINPGQPARKGRKKKTLAFTLGSPPEKGEERKKKKPWY
jgi:hypothetical protein